MKNRLPFKAIFSIVFFLMFGVILTYAQTKFFRSFSPEEGIEKMKSAPSQNITKFLVLELNDSLMKSYLSSAPSSKNAGESEGIPLEIPMPDGTIEVFQVYESSVLSAEQQALHPEIRTYKGQGTAHPGYRITFTLTSIGFSAIITGVDGDIVMIEKVKNVQQNLYKVYFSKYAVFPEDLHSGDRCKTLSINHGNTNGGSAAKFTNGADIKTFRIAIAATGEFTVREGGQANAFAKVVQYVTEMNAIYEAEMGITFTLVSGNNLIYANPTTDPYTNDNENMMLDENQTNTDNVIGAANYDVGHVLGASGDGSGGGVALSPGVCQSWKAQGASRIGSEVYYAHVFSTQLVAHEIGHQFGMSHSYNSNIPVCTTREYSTSVEPGSGATIMSYGFTCSNSDPSAGVTGNDDYHNDVQGGVYVGSFLNFHIKSIEQSLAYLATVSCNTSAPSGNTPPLIAAMQTSYTIPKSTPFQLSVSATDADSDPLSYSWEGTNISSMPAIPDPDDPDQMISPPELDGTVLENTELPPFFRSYPPVASGERIYPLLSAILDGSNYAKGDKLPSVAYVTTHTLSVRDGNGGLTTEDVTVNVDDSGPFLITNDPTGTYNGNSNLSVTWSVNGTTAAPVNCTLVDIWLSTDGGYTFTTQLANAIPNSGTAYVILPNITTSEARLKIMPSTSTASENIPSIFFDISNSDFTINNANNIIWTINNEWSNSSGPTINDDVLIEGILLVGTDFTSFEAKSLTVAENAQIHIQESHSVKVAEKITNAAGAENFTVENGASLVQISNDLNEGEITVKRNSGNLVPNDVTFWSSPVLGQSISAFTDTPYNASDVWAYDTANDTFVNSSDTEFRDGLGYAIRSNNFTGVYNAQFTGVPINGNITISGNTEGLRYNLTGNPYPAPIDAFDFFAGNMDVTRLLFWTHSAPLVNGHYASSNYAHFTMAGGVASAAGGEQPNGQIQIGQGFMTRIASGGNTTISFTNSMRKTNNNGQFYKNDNIERNRIWLNLTSEMTNHNQLMIAYMEGATSGVDDKIDASFMNYNGNAIYTLIENNKYLIQGLGLPFKTSDVVKLGFKVVEAGNFTISIENVDGIFAEGQMVYLKDKALDITHNLSDSAYNFSSAIGDFNDRFEVVYETEETMGVGDLTANSVQVYTQNNNIVVSSKSEKILSVEVFDLSGRNIHSNQKINANLYQIASVVTGTLVIRVQTQNGEIIARKAIIK